MYFDFYINTLSRDKGLDPNLTRAVIRQESNFHPDIIAKEYKRDKKGKKYFYGNSYGLMQVLDRTAIRYFGFKKKTLKKLLDPAVNIDVGTTILKDLQAKFPGNISYVLSGYNAGLKNGRPKRDKYGRLVNRHYVKRVMRFYKYYTLKKYFPVLAWGLGLTILAIAVQESRGE